jgi:hypothetical protein
MRFMVTIAGMGPRLGPEGQNKVFSGNETPIRGRRPELLYRYGELFSFERAMDPSGALGI